MNTRDKPPLEGPLDQYMTAGFNELEEERIWAKVRARRAHMAKTSLPSGVVLPCPIAKTLLNDEGLDKPRAQLWRQVRARVHRPEKRRYWRLALGTISVASVAAACVLLFLTWRMPEPVASRATPKALLVTDGRPLDAVETSTAPRTVRLSDASEIRLAAQSRVEPLSSSGSRFELLLARGSAEFSVTPGGPRRWLVEAGAARVEVVGTVFRVARTGTAVRVSVSRGSVLVRGENVQGWVQRLNAGEHLTVTGKERAHVAPMPTVVRGDGAQASAVTSQPAIVQMTEPLPARAPQASSRTTGNRRRSAPENVAPARDLTPAERYASLGPTGLARATMNATSIDELLELADIARLSGHPQDAVAPLTRALDAFRSSRQAALAAFTLGRVLLEQLDAAVPAAEAFERALVLGLPRGLRADCYRRLAEAYDRSGNYEQSIRAEHRLREEATPRAQEVEPGAAP